MTFKRGQMAYYDAGHSTVKAVIRTVHRDGDVSVEPFHFVDASGKSLGGPRIGGLIRMPQVLVREFAYRIDSQGGIHAKTAPPEIPSAVEAAARDDRRSDQ